MREIKTGERDRHTYSETHTDITESNKQGKKDSVS